MPCLCGCLQCQQSAISWDVLIRGLGSVSVSWHYGLKDPKGSILINDSVLLTSAPGTGLSSPAGISFVVHHLVQMPPEDWSGIG